MDELRFPTFEPGEGLTFSEPTIYSDSRGKVESFRVTVEAAGLTASTVVWNSYDDGFERLAKYFERMAADFRGWDGDRVWEQAEPPLSFAARHDRISRISLEVRLDQLQVEGPWSATVRLTLDPGTALDGTTRGLRRFLRR